MSLHCVYIREIQWKLFMLNFFTSDILEIASWLLPMYLTMYVVTIKAQKLFQPVSFSHIKAVEWMICIQLMSFGWHKIIIHNIKNLRFIWSHCCMHDHSICDAATIRGMSFNNKKWNFTSFMTTCILYAYTSLQIVIGERFPFHLF